MNEKLVEDRIAEIVDNLLLDSSREVNGMSKLMDNRLNVLGGALIVADAINALTACLSEVSERQASALDKISETLNAEVYRLNNTLENK